MNTPSHISPPTLKRFAIEEYTRMYGSSLAHSDLYSVTFRLGRFKRSAAKLRVNKENRISIIFSTHHINWLLKHHKSPISTIRDILKHELVHLYLYSRKLPFGHNWMFDKQCEEHNVIKNIDYSPYTWKIYCKCRTYYRYKFPSHIVDQICSKCNSKYSITQKL